MAGRPRLYANAAEKTRAFRERKQKDALEFNEWAERNSQEIMDLFHSVIIAKHRGDELALSLRTEKPGDLMQDLANYFLGESATSRT